MEPIRICDRDRFKLLFLCVVLFSVVGACDRKESEKSVEESSSRSAVKEAKIQSQQALGPAGKLVQTFFRNWEFKRFAQMHALTVNSRNKEIFERAMAKTPISWKNLRIISEESSGDDWYVSISLEVTNLPSAFAAYVVNMRLNRDNDPNQSDLRFSPRDLGIERFMPIKQKWYVVHLGDDYLIDVGAGQSRIKREDNILNYFLDAGMTDMPSLSGTSREDQTVFSATMWMSNLSLDLGLSETEIRTVMDESTPLVAIGQQNLLDLVKEFKRAIPEATPKSYDRIEVTQSGVGIDIIKSACELYEMYILVIRDKTSLEDDADFLDAEGKAKITRRVRSLKFPGATEAQLAAVKEVNTFLLQFIENAPSDGYTVGYKQGELMYKTMGLLAEFKITGDVARKHGFARIDSIVDAQLQLARGMLLIVGGIKKEGLEKARKPVRLFIEYLLVMMFIKEKDDKARGLTGAALLALTNEDISDVSNASRFRRLQEALLTLYEEPSNLNLSGPLAIFPFIIKDHQITDEELRNAGAAQLVELTQSMRGLTERRKTGTGTIGED